MKKTSNIPKIGIHVSGFGPLPGAVARAVELDIPVFQFFTGNARSWESKPLDPEDVKEFRSLIKQTGILPVAHMPYIPNLAAPDSDIYTRSVKTLIDEMIRCHKLGVPYLVTHLGSHKGEGEDGGRERIVGAVKAALDSKETGNVILLLENTAGTKNSLGTTFADIGLIINAINSDRVGLCFDTAHGLAAGYDLRSPEGVEIVLKEMKKSISVEKLKLIHLNDSKVKFGGHADRHEHLGEGHLGERGIKSVLLNRTLRKLPFILETPEDENIDAEENIRRARAWAEK